MSIAVGLARRSSRTNSGQERVDVTVFQNIGDGALAPGMRCQFRRGVAGVHDDLGLGGSALQSIQYLEAVTVPEPQVEHEHVHRLGLRSLERRGSG